MRSLFLTFKPDTSEEERKALLDRFRTVDGVYRTAKLSPGSTHPELSRFAFVDVDSDKAMRGILEALRRDPATESVDPPARRPCCKPSHRGRRV